MPSEFCEYSAKLDKCVEYWKVKDPQVYEDLQARITNLGSKGKAKQGN